MATAATSAAPATSSGRRGRRRAGARQSAGGSARSSDGSCSRIARSSRRSGGLGSKPSFGAQPGRGTAVRVERLRLPTAAVEREHQQAEQVLAVGMSRDQPLELTDHLPVAADGELRLDPSLGCREHQLLELRDLRALPTTQP